jgi:hypothetical protein
LNSTSHSYVIKFKLGHSSYNKLATPKKENNREELGVRSSSCSTVLPTTNLQDQKNKTKLAMKNLGSS